MTPIRPEMRDRYPTNWKAISRRIRFDRADGRCECRGECGKDHAHATLTRERPARCSARHGRPNPATASKVVLTVAHLDHDPTRCSDDNLRAMCQACHLAYDADHHAKTRRLATKEKKQCL